MTRVVFERMKDGRIPGVLLRRLLAALIERPGQVVSPEWLAPRVWPDGPPKTWRICLPEQVKHLNRILKTEAVERVGTRSRIDGFRLHVRLLPNGNLLARKQKPVTRWPWSSHEDAYLKRHAGTLALSQMVAGVNAIHGRERKPQAVEGRLYVLGLSKRIRAYSANSLAPILGVDGVKIARWIERGMLTARRTEPDGWQPGSKRWGWWIIEPADVEAFVRAYPYEIDWRAMQPGHPLSLLARSVQRANPYLTIAEAARRVGCSETALWQRLIAGHVPGYVRVTPCSPGADPARATIRIPLSAINGMPARLAKGRRPTIDQEAAAS